MISMYFLKRMRRILGLVLAVCFLVIPAAGLNEAAESEAEAAETQSGEKHWYTFSVLPWGILSSTNVKYIALYEPCIFSDDSAWAIGRVKGMSTNVDVYTNDPEERLIWSYSPNNFVGLFLRSGITLPDPDSDPDSGYFAVRADKDHVFTLSDTTSAELAALRETVEAAGEPVPAEWMQADPENVPAAQVVFVSHELPMLQRWMLLSFIREGDRLVLLSWKEAETAYEPDRFVEIDPESELYSVAAEAVDAAAPEQP